MLSLSPTSTGPKAAWRNGLKIETELHRPGIVSCKLNSNSKDDQRAEQSGRSRNYALRQNQQQQDFFNPVLVSSPPPRSPMRRPIKGGPGSPARRRILEARRGPLVVSSSARSTSCIKYFNSTDPLIALQSPFPLSVKNERSAQEVGVQKTAGNLTTTVDQPFSARNHKSTTNISTNTNSKTEQDSTGALQSTTPRSKMAHNTIDPAAAYHSDSKLAKSLIDNRTVAEQTAPKDNRSNNNSECAWILPQEQHRRASNGGECSRCTALCRTEERRCRNCSLLREVQYTGDRAAEAAVAVAATTTTTEATAAEPAVGTVLRRVRGPEERISPSPESPGTMAAKLWKHKLFQAHLEYKSWNKIPMNFFVDEVVLNDNVSGVSSTRSNRSKLKKRKSKTTSAGACSVL